MLMSYCLETRGANMALSVATSCLSKSCVCACVFVGHWLVGMMNVSHLIGLSWFVQLSKPALTTKTYSDLKCSLAHLYHGLPRKKTSANLQLVANPGRVDPVLQAGFRLLPSGSPLQRLIFFPVKTCGEAV